MIDKQKKILSSYYKYDCSTMDSSYVGYGGHNEFE